jgi:predicted small lipoprotein YifL
MTAVRRIAFLLLPTLLAAGCGQKGPLYLEGREPHSQRAPAPAQPESAPAEKEPARKEPH